MDNETFPAVGATNANLLYKGLGTFWTQVFQEKGTLRGLTQAQAEELIQQQYNLLEVLNSFAVSDVEVFHKEKWFPITLYKSKLNQAPLRFNQNDAVFGAQPQTDPYYAGVTFQFGYPKIPTSKVYTYTLEERLKNIFVIADRIINPSIVLVQGNDVILNDGILYFNKDVFNIPEVVKTTIINEFGEPLTYVDTEGREQVEETVTLWVYHGQLDKDTLWQAFGSLFNIRQDSSQVYKDLLKAVFAVYVDGPTVKAIKTLCATLLGVPVVETASEVIEHIFSDSTHHFIITDKNSYKYNKFYAVHPTLKVGDTVTAGDVLVDAVSYYDSVTYPNWWNRNVISIPASENKPYLSLDKNLFVGNYKFQLTFKAGVDLVTVDQNNKLHFPVLGSDQDVNEFNTQIDTPGMREALGVSGPGSVAVVNPVDFLFRNFFKNNTAMIKLKFQSNQVTAAFLESVNILLNSIPKHIYLIFDMLMTLPYEVYAELNNSTPIAFTDQDIRILNADGSDEAGMIESIAPHYYKDVKKRLFSIGKSPEMGYEKVIANSDTSIIDDDNSGDIGMVVNVGSVDSSGYATPLRPIPVGASTATYSNLELIKFN